MVRKRGTALAMRAQPGRWRDYARRGIAAVELALTLPIWITLFLGMSDGCYYLLVNEKTDRIAYTVTDIVTQYQAITLANLNDIVLAGGQLMQPLPATTTAANGTQTSLLTIIVSSIYQPSTGNPIVCWQYSGKLVTSGQSSGSKIGSPGGSSTCASGGTATLPGGLTLNAGDNVIITEVYYNFTPLFLTAGTFDAFTATNIYRFAVYKPRLSPLVTSPT
jgi:Flp pilus assembly protein TadG